MRFDLNEKINPLKKKQDGPLILENLDPAWPPALDF